MAVGIRSASNERVGIRRIRNAHGVGIVPTAGRTFYVHATNGSDSNNGLTSSAPLKTIAKVNTLALQAGDSVLFARGQTWTGTQLTAGSSGKFGSPITYGAYGSGANPVIDGNNLTNCVIAVNQSHLSFETLTANNGLDSGFGFNNCTGVVVTNCNADHAGNDGLLFLNNCQRCRVFGGTYSGSYNRLGTAISAGVEIADGGSDFVVSGVTLVGNQYGLTIHDHSSAAPQGLTNIPTNVLVTDCSASGNSNNGFQVYSQADGAIPSVDITFDGCTSSGNTSDGFRVYKSTTATVYVSGSVVFQNGRLTSNARYGYYIQGDDVTLRRVVSTSKNQIQDSKRVALQHLTHYWTVNPTAFFTYITGTRVDTVTARNCIWHTTDNTSSMVGTAAGANTNVSFDYNLYYLDNTTGNRWIWGGTTYTYANWRATAGQDAHSPTSNTVNSLFTDPATGDFTLQAGSPAIDKGVVIAGVNDNFLGVAPDLGYAEKQ